MVMTRELNAYLQKVKSLTTVWPEDKWYVNMVFKRMLEWIYNTLPYAREEPAVTVAGFNFLLKELKDNSEPAAGAEEDYNTALDYLRRGIYKMANAGFMRGKGRRVPMREVHVPGVGMKMIPVASMKRQEQAERVPMYYENPYYDEFDGEWDDEFEEEYAENPYGMWEPVEGITPRPMARGRRVPYVPAGVTALPPSAQRRRMKRRGR